MVKSSDVSVLIGGDAGQGVESGGAGFALAAARAGLHVFARGDNRSRIRGGHNFYQVRLADRPVYAHSREAQLLVAFTADSLSAHLESLAEGGAVLLPERVDVSEAVSVRPDLMPVRLPLSEIAEKHGSRLMMNTGALAAAAALVGIPFAALAGVIQRNFAAKGTDTMEANLRVAEEAYSVAWNDYASDFAFRVPVPSEPEPRLLMNGNQALALGAFAGGCRFIAAYPMTPATSIFEWLAGLPADYGVVAKHAEDEIAAVCMAIGASFAGARAMTATSGGGFCLMVEAMGLAGMSEVPVVIVNAQRGGPSTGLPTRTEQSDLLFAINAGQGEFPRIVLAPATVEECFESGWRSFNLADKYQCPVVIMTDSFLASSLKTVDPCAVDFGRVVIDRGETLDGADLNLLTNGYRRFEVTDSGISPRALPGDPRAILRVTSDEHDEAGHISEDEENRVRMMGKRMRKLESAQNDLRGPSSFGPPDADVSLVCWGSTFGACREAAELLNRDGASVNVLRFSDLWPLPAQKAGETLLNARRLVAVEQNYTSQLARLLRAETGVHIERTINKYDGRPFPGKEIADALAKEVGIGIGS